MMIEDRLLEQEWYQELTSDQKVMYIYLLHGASKKTGIVELNMRQLNFMANLSKPMTKEDVLTVYGDRIRLLPGRENTAIFPDFISVNWIRGDKPIDTVKNPLFKSIVQELAKYGLTIDDVNAMAKRKIQIKKEETGNDNIPSDSDSSGTCGCEQPQVIDVDVTKYCRENDLDKLFNSFWEEYPSNCPRKVDKKKCSAKFKTILAKSNDYVKTYNDIMNGLEVWKRCDTWTRENGQFIRAPLVWLNNESWNDKPIKGNNNGNKSANANNGYKNEAYSNLF